MSVYKPPHYITLGIYVMVNTPDDKIAGVPIALTEVSEEGIGAEIEKATGNLIAAGLVPVTQEEHDALAREWLAQEKAKQLAEAMRDQAKYDTMLAAHKGLPGGDA